MNLPQNREAEKNLLSALIVDPTMYYEVSGVVTDQSFYATKHQQIFSAIAELIKRDEPVEVLSLSKILNGKLPISELYSIANILPTGARAEYYAGLVRDAYVTREAVNTMRLAVDRAVRGGEDIRDIIASVQKDLDIALPQKRTTSDIYPAILDTMERLIDLPRGGVKNYIPTGFGKLDRQVKLTPGTLTLIAADPGVGKTSYLLCVARHMAKNKKRPLMFTLEMTREQIMENIIAQELGLCHRDMINGELTEQDNSRLQRGLKMFSDLNVGVLDGRWTTNEIRHQLITEVRTKGADCLMIDSLGKTKLPPGMSKVGELHKIYNVICEELVDIAVEMHIPVLLAHHLNRDSQRRGRDGRPTLGSLREAGEQWAHNVILIHRPYLITQDEEDKDSADFIIVKARDGEVGTVELGFKGPSKTFYNIEEHREPPRAMAGAYQN